MITPIEFDDYDKITDLLLYLSDNITLSFTVNLSRKGKTGERIFFQYETESKSKYIGSNFNRAIKRSMTFYFSIDNKKNFDQGLILRPQDVYLLVTIIDKRVLQWFFGSKRIFSIIDNRLVIKGNYEPINYTQTEYKYISFIPIVYTYDNNIYKEGVRIYINSQYEYADLDIDKFLGFFYILKNTDMYSVACSMVNYVKAPPHGLNIFSSVGLGGGHIEDPWPTKNEYKQDHGKPKSNTFLNNAKKKGEE